jgi:hypothetical protein
MIACDALKENAPALQLSWTGIRAMSLSAKLSPLASIRPPPGPVRLAERSA